MRLPRKPKSSFWLVGSGNFIIEATFLGRGVIPLVKHFFHYVFSTNSFLPFTWFLLNPFMYFALQFSRHVFSTDVIHAFYPTFFDSRDLHLSRSCFLPYVFSMMCFSLKLITHFTLGFFQHVFSTKAFHTFYPRFFRARAFH